MLKPIRIFLPFLALALLAPALLVADPVTVGQVLYGASSGSAGLPGFTVYNYTGPSQGCNAGFGTPVCDSVNFTGTSLVVTFANGNQITSTPVFAFGPGGYLYGDNVGDDPAQSFLFDTAVLGYGDITDAVFSGSFSQTSFAVAGGGAFTSTGTFTSDINLLADGSAGTFDVADIDAIEAPNGSPVPEPAAWWLLATGLGGLVWMGRRRAAALLK